MGRFSKLETGQQSPAQGQPGEGEELRLPTRKPGSGENELPAGSEYDQGYYIKQAEDFFYTGEYQKALRQYSRAMQVDHSSVEPWLGQVHCLVNLKQYREAAVWVLRGLEMFPEDARLVALQGLTYALNGTIQRGLACSDYSMTRPNAQDPFVWCMRGQILSMANNPNADFCFDKAMEIARKDDWKTAVMLGVHFLRERKWSRAAQFLERAAQANPSNGYIWRSLGLARERLGFSQGALDAYDAALGFNPNDLEARDGMRRVADTSLPRRIFRRLFGH